MTRMCVKVVWALGVVVLLQGCTMALKESIAAGRGAKGPYMPITPAQVVEGEQPLKEYQTFQLGRFVDEIGGKVPATLIPEFRLRFVEMLEKNKVPNTPGGKTLLIQGRILHYEGSGTMAVVTSGVEEVVVRTELVDKTSGKVLAVSNCIGRSTSRINRGVPKKATGLAKSIAGWISQLYHGE